MKTEINILGKVYKITYVDKTSDVDIGGKRSLTGQIDPWTRTIRILQKDQTKEDIWETLLHEILHGIADTLKLTPLSEDEETINLLSIALADTLARNGFLEVSND